MNNQSGAVSNNAELVLESIFQALRSRQRTDGLGTIIQILSADSHAGTSYVARGLAELAAKNASGNQKRVGLFDCDLHKLSQTVHYFAPSRAEYIDGPFDATFGAGGYWKVTNQQAGRVDIPDLCGIYIDGQTGLAFTSLIWDKLSETDYVELETQSAYWQNLRSHFSFIFIDCAALDRSQDGLMIAPHCDMSVLVTHSDQAQSSRNLTARDNILIAGGQFAGLVVNGGAPLFERQQANA